MISVVQSKIAAFASSASAQTLTLDSPTAAGNTIALIASARKASNAATSFTVIDDKSNAFRGGLKGRDAATVNKGTIAAFYAPDITSAGASHSVTVTPDAAAAVTFALVELHSPLGHIQPCDTQAAGDSDTGGEVAPLALPYGASFLLEAITHESTSAIAISEDTDDGFAMLVKSEADATNSPLAVMTKSNVSDAALQGYFLFDDGNTTATYEMVGIAFTDGAPTITATTPAFIDPQPVAAIDARDYSGWAGEGDISLHDRVTGLPVPTASGKIGQTGSVVSIDITALAGVSTGIFQTYSQPLGAIAICAKMERGKAGSIIGADDAGNGAHGAWTLSRDSTNNLIGQIVTGSSSASATSLIGESMAGEPVVYWIVNDGTHLIIEANGWEVGRLTISGTPLTPSGVLRIFNAWASGGDATPSNGSLYSIRCFSSVPTFAQRRAICSDMITGALGGPKISKRFIFVTHEDSGNAIAESDDGKAWVNAQRLSYMTPNPGNSQGRDWSFAGYDAGTAAYYWIHTYVYPDTGIYCAVAKSFGDFRLICPHAKIDATNGGFVNGTTVSPWGPMVIPNLGTPAKIKFTKSNTSTEYIGDIGNWPGTAASPPTMTNVTVITGNVTDQITYLRPGDSGNTTNSYYAFGGNGQIQTATALTGTYGNLVQLAGHQVGEGGFILPLDGGKVAYNNATDSHGWQRWVSSDGFQTWGAVEEITGLNTLQGGTINFGQGTFVDRKVIGGTAAWTPSPASSSLSLGVGLGL